MEWLEPSEAWWLLLSLCLYFMPCIFAGRILNLTNYFLWCLDIFSKVILSFFTSAYNLHLHAPPFILHNLQKDIPLKNHSTKNHKKDEGKLGGVLKLYQNYQPWCPSFSHYWQILPPVLQHLHQVRLLASDSSPCPSVSQGRWIRTGVSQDQFFPLQLPLNVFLCLCGTWKLL